MFHSSFISKLPLIEWLRKPSQKKRARAGRRPTPGTRYRFGFEMLEERLTLATFSLPLGAIQIALDTANEALTINSSGAGVYHFNTTGTFTAGTPAITPNTFSGFGSNSGDLTISGATQINVVDLGAVAGGHVIFVDSGVNAYAENFVVSLISAGAGNIDFFGASTFNNSLTASTRAGTVTVQDKAIVNLNGTGVYPLSTIQQTATGGSVQINGTVTTNAAETTLVVSAFNTISEGVAGEFLTNAATAVTFRLTSVGVGNINLNGGPNDFAGSVTINQTGGGSIRNLGFRNADPNAVLPILAVVPTNTYTLVTDNTSIPLGNGPNLPATIPTFAYTAGGDITQTAAALAFTTSATFTVLGNNNILLNTFAAGNTIPTVSFNALKGDNTTQVSYLGSAGVSIGASSLGLGTFNITAQGAGNITQAGVINEKIGAAGNTFTLAAAGTGASITLATAGNRFEGPITLAGPGTFTTVNLLNNSLMPQFPGMPTAITTLTLNYPNAPINLPNMTLLEFPTLANLTVTALGVFQQTGTTIVMPSAANVSFNAGSHPIVLGNANDFANIQVNNSGPNQVVINDINSLNFGVGASSLGNGTLAVTTGGNITQSGPIGQLANAGQTVFTATLGGSITLNTAGNQFYGILNLNTSGVGSADIANGVSLNMGTSVIGAPAGTATLTLNVTGSLTQDPGTTLTVAASSTLTATGNITLDNNGNAFHGAPSAANFVSANGGNVTLRTSSGPVNLGNCAVAGALIVRADGITQVAGTAITGAPTSSLFDAGTNAITLTSAGNRFTGVTSASSTGSAAVQLTAMANFQVGRFNLGTGALTLIAGGNFTEASGATSGIAQAAPGGAITLTTPGSISLNSSNNAWLVPLNLSTGATGGLTLINSATLPANGDISFVGTPAMTGAINLTSAGTITIPNIPYSVGSFTTSAKQTIVTQNVATTAGAITFNGTVNLGVPATLLTLTSSAAIVFNGNVNVLTTTGGLTLAPTTNVSLNQGTWSEGTSPLTISGAGVAFNVGNNANPATFNMISGAITMVGAGNVTVKKFATFEVGDTTTTATVDTVTVNNGAGTLNFNAGSTLSVGLGTVNDQLVDAAGNIIIAAPARLTAYSGVTGAAASAVLTATTGTVTGFFALTVDPLNSNASHVFLMGTDIVLPNCTAKSVTVVTGGTVSASGSVTGFEADSDKFTITASTGATAQLTTATDVNGLLDVVIRNAPGAVTLTITTTKNLGDGLTQLGGIAVDGPGAVTISAANTTINLGGIDPFADILVQGPLTALTMRDFAGATANFQDFIRAGGSNSQSTTITGRIFDSVSVSLPTVLTALTLAEYTNTVGIDTVTAERFGTIKTTGIANTSILGVFSVSRLTNLDTANSPLPGLGAVTIANRIQGQFDIKKAVTSVTSKLANLFSLGLPGAANNPNGDLTGNVTTLDLGQVTNSSIESIGNVSSTTAVSWSTGILKAVDFGTIKTTGSTTLPAPGDFGNFSNITLIATGNLAGVGLGTLTVAGDVNSVTFNILNGNVNTVTVSRQILSTTLNAGITTPLGVIVGAVNSKIGTITAAAFSSFSLNARLLTSINAVGNASAGIFGDIGSATALIQGMPNGSPIFTGVGIGTIKATRNIQGSSFTVVNGSLTTVTVGYQIQNSDFVLLNNAGKLGSLTAGAWSGQSSSGLVAQSIGSLVIKGAPLVVPNSILLIGNLANVNILAFANTVGTVGIGTFNVSGSYTLRNNGFLRSDNGIGTFTVGRDVATVGGNQNLISVRNPNAGNIGTITVGRWNGSLPATSVDFVADAIGTMKVTGYTAVETPSKVNGDFLANNFVLLNNAKINATSITVGFNQNVTNLLAPGGIGTLTVGVALVGRVDADNPKGTLGNVGTVQAGVIGDLVGPATLRAVTFGTIKTVINVPLSFGLAIGNAANGAMNNSLDSVTATSTTAAAGIGTVNIASFISGANFNVPRTITTFTVGEDIGNYAEIGAGYKTGQSIKTLTVGAINNSVVTSNSIGTLKVIGKTTTVFNAGILVANVSNSVITAEGNVSGVGLGTVTINQKVINSDINVAGGNVTSLTVGGIFGSHVTVGAHPVARGNLVATATGANWNTPVGPVTFTLGSFKTTGSFSATDVLGTANFRDSFIIAQRLGTVLITGLDQNVPGLIPSGMAPSPSATFGVAFRGTSPAGGPGPSIKVTFSNAGVLTTQTLVAPNVAGASVSTTPVSAFEYVNLGG